MNIEASNQHNPANPAILAGPPPGLAAPQPLAKPDSPQFKYRMLGLARKLDWRIIIFLMLAGLAFPIGRALTEEAKAHEAGLAVRPVQPVAVTPVTRGNLAQELVCDAELRPYEEIDLHAKVAGFLQNINVDIGDRVKAGQVLATIEVPELQDDISAAKANYNRSEKEVDRAQAAEDDAHLIYTRLQAVDKVQPNLVAEQDLDAARDKDRAAASALAAAQAQVGVAQAQLNKLQTILKYSQITAPFAGVITKRFADPGALIQAGISSSTQTLPLVRLSQNSRLRLDIPVSVSYVSRIHVGDPVEIRVDSLNDVINGTIARSTLNVETATRTMEVEVDVPNPDLRLIPGMYASAVLRLDHRENTLMIPVEAVSRQKDCTVLVVNPEHRIEERTVKLGLETPRKVEVLSGLKENEMVMIGSRAQVKAGQIVEPKLMAAVSGE
jgi:RND family efflux transporter MFP subunit